jgi:hypothetical protein
MCQVDHSIQKERPSHETALRPRDRFNVLTPTAPVDDVSPSIKGVQSATAMDEDVMKEICTPKTGSKLQRERRVVPGCIDALSSLTEGRVNTAQDFLPATTQVRTQREVPLTAGRLCQVDIHDFVTGCSMYPGNEHAI